MTESPAMEDLLSQAAQGEPEAADQLLQGYRERLRRLVHLRLAANLRRRVDASDVIQDAMAEAVRRLPEYVQQPRVPFYVWLRGLVCQHLANLYRHHVQAQCRSVKREQPADGAPHDARGAELAEILASRDSTPSHHLRRQEQQTQLRQALDRLSPARREVLVLRYLEQLSVAEIAAVLSVSTKTVRTRHRQALEHLQRILRSESRST